jgi:6-phosphogluconolactonase
MPDIWIYPDAMMQARAAAELFVSLAREAIGSRGWFHVALPGGSTPRLTFSMLAADEFSDQVHWERVHLFWGDERIVPPGHPGSNYYMTHEVLIDHVPVPPENVHRVFGELEPEAAADAYIAEMGTVFGEVVPRFDLVFLGLGKDGHVASLFPNSLALRERIWPVVAVEADYEGRPAHRVTLTLPAINAAGNVVFLVSGTSKADIVHAVLEGSKQGLPAQSVRPSEGQLIWILDKSAAGKLTVQTDS